VASLKWHESSRAYHIVFRHDGRQYRRSLGPIDEATARGMQGRIEETLSLLRLGRIVVPPGADAGDWIVSDGRRTGRRAAAKAAASPVTIAAMLATYEAELPAGAKEATTLAIERIHLRHVARLLGADTPLDAVDLAAAQRYVRARLAEKHGRLKQRPIHPYTAHKELKSFRTVWRWCADRKLVPAAPDWRLKQVTLPRDREPEPFRTMAEIRARVARGGLSAGDEKALWDALYLTGPEIRRLLEHVRSHFPDGCTYPMVAFAAYTGARRSELIRSRIEDFEFGGGHVRIREKKRVKGRESTRLVDLHPDLAATMQAWFGRHPGGQHALAGDDGSPLRPHEATARFEAAVRGTEWAVMRGIHVLRHSFASCLASAGVDQRVINAFMGHQSEQMAARYRHLFPKTRQSAILALGI
jgi:integrase